MGRITILSYCGKPTEVIKPTEPLIPKNYVYTTITTSEEVNHGNNIKRGNQYFRKLKFWDIGNLQENSEQLKEITLKMTAVTGSKAGTSKELVISNPYEIFEVEVTDSRQWNLEVIDYKTTDFIKRIDTVRFQTTDLYDYNMEIPENISPIRPPAKTIVDIKLNAGNMSVQYDEDRQCFHSGYHIFYLNITCDENITDADLEVVSLTTTHKKIYKVKTGLNELDLTEFQGNRLQLNLLKNTVIFENNDVEINTVNNLIVCNEISLSHTECFLEVSLEFYIQTAIGFIKSSKPDGFGNIWIGLNFTNLGHEYEYGSVDFIDTSVRNKKYTLTPENDKIKININDYLREYPRINPSIDYIYFSILEIKDFKLKNSICPTFKFIKSGGTITIK